MANVRVRWEDYEDGVLPEVCVRTGAPADVLVGHRSARGVAGWGIVLLLFLGPVGLVAWAILDRLVRREVKGLLPASRAAIEASAAARHRWDRVVVAGLVVAVAGGLVAVLAEGPLTGLGGIAVAVGVVAAIVGWFAPAFAQVQGTPERGDRWIELVGVSPAFARAYEAQDARRAQRRRAAEHGAVVEDDPTIVPAGG